MILILCPLKIELNYLLKSFEEKGLSFNKNQNAYVGEHLTLAVGGHGKVNFAISTVKLILEYKPSLLICSGAAGGIKNLKLLDIVAATKTVEHDYNIKFIQKDQPSFDGDFRALNTLKGVKKVIMASGDEDIIDSKSALMIHQKTQALAVAWEGAGGAKACAFMNTPFLELRCITDLCDQNTLSDFKENLEKGMAQVAHVIIDSFLNATDM